MTRFFQISTLIFTPLLLLSLLVSGCSRAASQNGSMAASQLQEAIDKSGDAELARLAGEVAPAFRQLEFAADGKTMKYNLYAPGKMKRGKKYPLVLFIADGSTVGRETTAPLTQGYGALLFASSQSQAKNPCYVLVPQFSGVAVNNAWQLSGEAEMILPLLNEVASKNAVDASRIYVTGQSMGGMLGMHYLSARPEIFAAGLFVDSYWNPADLDRLVQRPFIFVYAGNSGKAYGCEQAIEEACRKMSRSYSWAEWSARLPMDTQDGLAENLLGKGNPVNLVGFENGTVLPENGQGSEHMHSFDKAYQIAPLRNWLFTQKLK